jgi:hypothetical protein
LLALLPPFDSKLILFVIWVHQRGVSESTGLQRRGANGGVDFESYGPQISERGFEYAKFGKKGEALAQKGLRYRSSPCNNPRLNLKLFLGRCRIAHLFSDRYPVRFEL